MKAKVFTPNFSYNLPAYKIQAMENIKDWNNQPETIKKIENALKKHGVIAQNEKLFEVYFVKFNKGPSLSVQVEISYNDGYEDFWKTINLGVNRKGEFK